MNLNKLVAISEHKEALKENNPTNEWRLETGESIYLLTPEELQATNPEEILVDILGNEMEAKLCTDPHTEYGYTAYGRKYI